MLTGTPLTILKALALGALVLGCGSSGNQLTGTGGQGGGANSPTTTETVTLVEKGNPKVDILFVLMNWSGDPESQSKLYAQIPTFVNVLKSLPTPLDLHLAVTTTDMGAPGDVMGQINCPAQGDAGRFLSAPTGTCTATTLAAGATYLADDGNGVVNFTDPMATVLQCISMVGDKGCGFGQPLAALVHALGADDIQAGAPTPPSMNAGFLRPDASLAVILLVNQDDCSAPPGTALYSLDGGQDNLTNPLGPIGHYRCNQFGHLCSDPTANSSALVSPPLKPPSDAQGTAAAPTLDLTNCLDNDSGTGLLTPVSQFVSEIKALKADPDNQILAAAITAPVAPYTVAWRPAQGGQNTQPGELWAQVEFSCGPLGGDGTNPELNLYSSDGSFGEPGVRVSEFVNSFPNSVLASICDPTYVYPVQAIATKVGRLSSSETCLTGQIQSDLNGLPSCTAVAQVADAGGASKSVPYALCDTNGGTAPCWTLTALEPNCAGKTVVLKEPPGAPSSSVTVSCQICKPGTNSGASVPGC